MVLRRGDICVGLSPGLFISNFYVETEPIRDFEEMCRINTRELPGYFEGVPFTEEQLKLIERLTLEHLTNYMNGRGNR